MIFDTDVVIWCMRGYHSARLAIEAESARSISAVTYMELLQGMRDKAELINTKRFLRDVGFETIGISEAIGARAVGYMQQLCLKSGLSVTDAMIAATAVEAQETLCSGNFKHFKLIHDVQLKIYHHG